MARHPGQRADEPIGHYPAVRNEPDDLVDVPAEEAVERFQVAEVCRVAPSSSCSVHGLHPRYRPEASASTSAVACPGTGTFGTPLALSVRKARWRRASVVRGWAR